MKAITWHWVVVSIWDLLLRTTLSAIRQSFFTGEQKEMFSAWDPSYLLPCEEPPQTEQLKTSNVYHLPIFLGGESRHGLASFSASESHQMAIKVSAGLRYHLKIRLGRSTPKPTQVVGKSIPCSSRTAFCDTRAACFAEASRRLRATLARWSLI